MHITLTALLFLLFSSSALEASSKDKGRPSFKKSKPRTALTKKKKSKGRGNYKFLEKRTPTQIAALDFPFYDEFMQKKTTSAKLSHLKTWNIEMGEANDLNGRAFRLLLHLIILSNVEESESETKIECEQIERDLLLHFPRRYEIDDNAYILFNRIVDNLCPPSLDEDE